MDWLVDTNILIDHLRGIPKATTFLRQARSDGTLWLSAITVAEVYAGQGTRQSKQAAKVSLADLMIVRGNSAVNIGEIEKVEIVFKDGVGYDSEKLIQSVQGVGWNP